MKPWNAKLHVVEIWWEHEISEWLFDAAFLTKKDALIHAKKMRKSRHRFRVVPYVRSEKR